MPDRIMQREGVAAFRGGSPRKEEDAFHGATDQRVDPPLLLALICQLP